MIFLKTYIQNLNRFDVTYVHLLQLCIVKTLNVPDAVTSLCAW